MITKKTKKHLLKAQIESGLDKRYDEYKNLNNNILEIQINSIKI